MAMVLRRLLLRGKAISLSSASPIAQSDSFASAYSRFFSKSAPYAVKVGIPEFLQGIGGGVEAHVPKLESEIGDFNRLLVCRTLKLKKLGIPCKHKLSELIVKCAYSNNLIGINFVTKINKGNNCSIRRVLPLVDLKWHYLTTWKDISLSLSRGPKFLLGFAEEVDIEVCPQI